MICPSALDLHEDSTPLGLGQAWQAPLTDRAVSETAKLLRKESAERSQSSYLELPLLELERCLREVYEEAREPNWDGYGAKPVKPNTYFNARKILFAIADTVVPLSKFSDIGVNAEPDGEIAFEWYIEPYKTFSLSIGLGDKLTYAGLFGLSRVNGVDYFRDELPEAILNNLKRLCD